MRPLSGAVTRLSMPRSEALQVLLAEFEDNASKQQPTAASQPTSPTKAAESLQQFVPVPKAMSRRRFGSLLDGPHTPQKLRVPTADPAARQQQPTTRGEPPTSPASPTSSSASKSLFQWAAKNQDMHMPMGDFRTKALPLSSVDIRHIMEPKELVEIDRDLAGFRRLAEARAKCEHIWGDYNED
mmetsp:Transcript_138990/g.346494  ORF Transcript_138990/g.346494 Transcript_138990/m.346494 type:complete len:184 (-) Transcript_138990:197-748(-)